MKNAQQLRKNACFVLKKYAISKIFWGLSTVGHEKYHQKLHHQGIQSSAPFFQRGGQEESMAWHVRTSWQLAPPHDHAAVCCQCLFQSQVDCFLHLSPFIFCLFQIKIRKNLVAIIIRYQFQHLDNCSECQHVSLGQRQGLDLTITSYFVRTGILLL